MLNGACVDGYHIVVCGCMFRKGGKIFNAHASTWASIRELHTLPFLCPLSRTHVEVCARALVARARTHTYTCMYIRTRVSWDEKAFRFCNVGKGAF